MVYRAIDSGALSDGSMTLDGVNVNVSIATEWRIT